MQKIGRNDLCHCGSGKKYKKCCMGKDVQLIAKQVVHNHDHHILTHGGVNELSSEMEQMSDLIEKGYEYLAENNSISACDTWLKSWEALKARIKPTFKSLDELEKHYQGSFFMRNFCQDLEVELYNAGLDDPRYFSKRIHYCREFCEYFPKEDELIIHNMRRAIADSYAKLDQYGEAELEFKRLVREFPNNPWGYIGWGDIFFFENKKDYHKARELYEKALSIAKVEMDIEAIMERIEDLKESL